MPKSFMRVYPFLLILLLLMALSSTAQEAPIQLSPDTPVLGSFDSSSAADVYSFEAAANSVITLTVSSDDTALGLLLSDSSGAILEEAAAEEAGTFTLPDFTLSAAGTYFVTVFTAPGSEGNYELTLSLVAPEVEAPPVAGSGDIVTELPEATDILLNNGIEVRLQWNATVDLNLEVRDPVGNSLHFDSRTSPIGGSFGFDANGFCEIPSDAPVETAVWRPGFLPTGSYEILVFYRQTCEGAAQAVPFSLTVTVNGQVLPAIEATIAPPPTVNSDSVYLANFVLVSESTANLNDGGAYPDTAINQLPATFAELSAQALPIERDIPVTGAIFEEQDFVVYSFEAEANEIISVSMGATSRNLDTLVQLIDPNGLLVAANDDTSDSTNSVIPNARILQTGTYYVVASRYGKQFGGTEGEFTLIVTESTGALPQNLASLALPEGDIQVYLTWNTNADLQLLVRDPVGQSIYDDFPQVTSGGLLAADGNVNCIQEEGDPVSYIYWPAGLLRQGTYEVDVWFENTCQDTTPVTFTLTVVVRGQVVMSQIQSPTIGAHYVSNFTVNADGTAIPGLAGFTNSGITPEMIANEEELPISFNLPVTGAITSDNPFDVYTFAGQAGQQVTITMQRSAGTTLDTNLYLLSEAGIQLANNDDAPAGTVIGVDERSTDSLISFNLTTDGNYFIVATRFGLQFGGTTGTYQLTVQLNEE